MELPQFPEASWSKSRQNLYETCPLQFYFNYYEKWQGWHESAKERKRKAYFWSNRTTIPMWKGSIIHKAISKILHGENSNDVKSSCTIEIRKDWWRSLSRAKKLREYGFDKGPLLSQRPKDIILMEHLDPDFPKDVVDELIEDVEDSIDVFLKSEQFKEYKRSEKDAALYNFAEEPSGFHPIYVDFTDECSGTDVKVWAMLDCAYEVEPNTFLIYDWKTGNPFTEHSERYLTDQLIVYAHYIMNMIQRGVRPRPIKIEAYELYLKDPIELVGGIVTDDELDVRIQGIAEQVSNYKKLHDEIESYTNKYKEYPFDEDYMFCPAKPKPSESICKNCQFQFMCPHDINKS
jgi:hypothetical protein